MKDGTGTFSVRERGMVGMHYINITSDALDTTWITADFTAAESAFQTFWSAVANRIPNDVRLVEHRWYAFGPGVVPPNPPVRVTTLGTPIVGTQTSGYGHQIGSTVTFRTALRRHWGRIYMPVGPANITAGGQFGTVIVDNLADAARTMLNAALASQGVIPVVYDRNRKSMFGISALEVDSVPDVQRRRRPRSTVYRKLYETAP